MSGEYTLSWYESVPSLVNRPWYLRWLGKTVESRWRRRSITLTLSETPRDVRFDSFAVMPRGACLEEAPSTNDAYSNPAMEKTSATWCGVEAAETD